MLAGGGALKEGCEGAPAPGSPYIGLGGTAMLLGCGTNGLTGAAGPGGPPIEGIGGPVTLGAPIAVGAFPMETGPLG